MANDYEAARAIANAASTAEFILPEYLGSTSDLAYLKDWVLDQVTSIYGVTASVFDTATVYSTSILRDFVHRALYQTMDPNFIEDITPTSEFAGWNDVALGFRYPAYGLCGFMAWQMWEVYRAFGYDTHDISTINEDVTTYTDGHVTTQVWVTDLQQYIIQDATFNFIYRDEDGNILSFYEARDLVQTGGTLEFDGFTNYRSYYYGTTEDPELNSALQDYFRAEYLDSVFWWYGSDGVRHEWLPGLFLDWTTAHDAASNQGGEFVTRAAALAAIDQYDSLGWTQAAQALRSQGYYVSGFAFGDPLNTYTSQWLTVRLDSGEYISIELQTGTVLNGSFDQLASEATGGTVRNAGADLSIFLRPFYLLNLDGTVKDAGGPYLAPNDRGGSSGDDQLNATADYTRVFGFDGSDTLYGAYAAGLLVGGLGNDNYAIVDARNVVLEKAGEGIDTVYAYVDYTIPANVEIMNLHGSATTGIGSTGSEWLVGNALNNTLRGMGGNDYLIGGAGNDVLDGRGAGAANMSGQTDNDTYYVDSQSDKVVEAIGGGSDTIITDVNYVLAAGSEVELLRTYGSSSTSPVTLTGNEFANTIIGNAAANTINGGAGADVMWGCGGDDRFFVDTMNDQVMESVGGGYDTVITDKTYTLRPGAEVEMLRTYGSAGTQAVNLFGNEFNNLVTGNSGKNVVGGGGGNDTLWGYAGADTFFFYGPNEGADKIMDFNVVDDQIAMSRGFGVTAGTLAQAGVDFVQGSAATAANETLIYNASTGNLYWDDDGSGAHSAVLLATLINKPALTQEDFFVV
jgi:Ca2+-binding RTX toxin-like protein